MTIDWEIEQTGVRRRWHVIVVWQLRSPAPALILWEERSVRSPRPRQSRGCSEDCATKCGVGWASIDSARKLHGDLPNIDSPKCEPASSSRLRVVDPHAFLGTGTGSNKVPFTQCFVMEVGLFWRRMTRCQLWNPRSCCSCVVVQRL